VEGSYVIEWGTYRRSHKARLPISSLVSSLDNPALPNANKIVPDAVVVCVGLGARTLGGVEDPDVYPVRGQVSIIRAPWIKFGVSEKTKEGISYVIPRQSGDVCQSLMCPP
jgi:hypothetical protein